MLFFLYNVWVWGLLFVVVVSIVVFYIVGIVLIWMFDFSDNNFFLIKLGVDGGDVCVVVIQKVINVFIMLDGFMGWFMDIVVNQVFFYVVLGVFFGILVGGILLIKLVVWVMWWLCGGLVYVVIVFLVMFGIIIGGFVINVLFMGCLMILMMCCNGFLFQFVGGVEVVVLLGGQIMLFVMGVVVFVLVVLMVVFYIKVIIVVFILVMVFFFLIFLVVMFQVCKENVVVMNEIFEDLQMQCQDWLNLIIIFVLIMIILLLLLGNKDVISSGWIVVVFLSFLIQILINVIGDVVLVGWWVVVVLILLLFFDFEICVKLSKVFVLLVDGGLLILCLFLLFFVVLIIFVFLNESGLMGELICVVILWLENVQVI